MYDAELENELKNFKIGAQNIEELRYRYEYISKVIANRTKEKVNFLNLMVKQNKIDTNLYKELLDRVKQDYKESKLYVIGLNHI